MIRGRIAANTAVIVVATIVFINGAAYAEEFDGVARGNALEVRGTTSTHGSAPAARAVSTGESPSTTISNCVPIPDSDLLRCYRADTAAPDNAGIDAFTVDPAPGLPSAAAIAAAVASELHRLPLRSGGITIQPGSGWTLVNVETIALTDPAAQTFDVAVLGIPVSVVARPAHYTWSFDDGTPPLATTEPGAAWPNQTVTHVFRTTGARSITLTTEWTGTFRVAGGGGWQPIDGTAVTVETAPPLEVVEATNRLVSAP